MKNSLQRLIWLSVCLICLAFFSGGYNRLVGNEGCISREDPKIACPETILMPAQFAAVQCESESNQPQTGEEYGKGIVPVVLEGLKLSTFAVRDANGNILSARQRYKVLVYQAFAPENGFG